MAEQAYLNSLASQAREILDNLKVPYRKKAPISIGKFKSFYGQCYVKKCPSGIYKYRIEIADWLLNTKNEDAIIDTILHEYLHTVDPKVNHTGAWKRWAKVVSNNTKYQITACTPYSESGISEEVLKEALNYKYKVTCECCGQVWHYMRSCKFIKNGGKDYRCSKCGEKGKFRIEQSQ